MSEPNDAPKPTAPSKPLGNATHGDERSRLGNAIRARELRRLKAKSQPDRTVWNGVSSFGAVGWSIATPTLLGIVAGLWLDKRLPSKFSWTIALLMAGLCVGCVMAWNWVQQERNTMDESEK